MNYFIRPLKIFVLFLLLANTQYVASHGSYPTIYPYTSGLSYHIHGGFGEFQESCSGTYYLGEPLILEHEEKLRGSFVGEYVYRCYYAHSSTLNCAGGVTAENAAYCTPPEPAAGPLAPTVNNGHHGCDAPSPSNYTNNPINIATGSKYFSDHYFTGRGDDPLSLSFFYNSNSNHAMWTHTYSQSLDIAESRIEASGLMDKC